MVIIAHNLRSTHNIGSILRTADGLGVAEVLLTGYSPYPKLSKDDRLPHIAAKLDAQISKTALGAEKSVAWRHITDITEAITLLKNDDYKIYALEQAVDSKPINKHQPEAKIALIIGREVEGLEDDVIKQCDGVLEIPMYGAKESFNVAAAAAMALYHCTFA